MDVRLKPKTEARLAELEQKTGKSRTDLIEDAIAGYLDEVTEVRKMVDTRYDEVKSGRVRPVEGEVAFARLRRKSSKRSSSGS